MDRELTAKTPSWKAQRPSRRAGRRLSCPPGPINTIADLFEDPQFKARGMLVEAQGTPGLRNSVLMSELVRATRSKAFSDARPEHPSRILREIGLRRTKRDLAKSAQRGQQIVACCWNSKQITIYCGSSGGGRRAVRLARRQEELGRTLAAEQVRPRPYGGGGEGLMGTPREVDGQQGAWLCDRDHPELPDPRGTSSTAVQEMLVVEDMHERKRAMFDRADAFIATRRDSAVSPGRARRTTHLGPARHHTKPILIVDIGGF